MKLELFFCLAVLSSAPISTIVDRGKEPADEPAAVKPEEREEAITGVVKQKEDSQILVKRDDGHGDIKVNLSDNVRVIKNDAPASANDLVFGVHVEVRVELKGDSLGAVSIRILNPKPT